MNKTEQPENFESSVSQPDEKLVFWLEGVLPQIMRCLMDSENLDMPLLQLPLAQMRLAQALFSSIENADSGSEGETMGRLSERLGVRHNALTQAADRLVNHGLAERLSDILDRRIVRLKLTSRGATWVRERRDRRRDHLSKLWSVLDDLEREEFISAVRTLETVGKKLTKPKSDSSENPDKRIIPTVEETLSRFTVGTMSEKPVTIKD